MSVVSNDLGARLQELVSARGWTYDVKPGSLNGWWVTVNMPDEDLTKPVKGQLFRSEGTPEGAARSAIIWLESLDASA